ncbi:MAG TPA: HepT-like ribonuclease domain-containing protein [Pyrinomonadaceae bacterium]|nr:HepT-like ribonuclease domain-containing protein [Pyrinomonadaceae bacterium]
MLDAAREALSFVAGKERRALDENRMLLLSLVKSVEIIGEAAGRVSDECRASCSEIPWLNIVGMRNRLIHAYFNINVDIVWQTATGELPSLIVALENCLASSAVE